MSVSNPALIRVGAHASAEEEELVEVTMVVMVVMVLNRDWSLVLRDEESVVEAILEVEATLEGEAELEVVSTDEEDACEDGIGLADVYTLEDGAGFGVETAPAGTEVDFEVDETTVTSLLSIDEVRV